MRGTWVWVTEVKSLTEQNEEQQLRLGLGQVLRYRDVLRSQFDDVTAVLAVERAPETVMWLSPVAAVHSPHL